MTKLQDGIYDKMRDGIYLRTGQEIYKLRDGIRQITGWY